MEKNKSIDGLSTRSAKKTVAKSVVKVEIKKSTTIKKENIKKEPSQKIPVQSVQDINEDFLKPITTFDFDEKSGELTQSQEPVVIKNTEKEETIKNKKKHTSKKRKIITSILLVFVILIIGVIVWGLIWGNDIIAKITGGNGNIWDAFTFLEEKYEPLAEDENGRTNILLFGTSGYNMDGDEGDGTHDGAQLTDSIMVTSLNQTTGDIALMSLPRDLKASPTCTATGKINEVYWCNNMNGDNEDAGARALMDEVGSILGVNFQYYAHFNWGSLVSIVDSLGGITVTLDEDIMDYAYTGAVFEAGVTYTVNGEEALGIARARHGTTGGDFSRGASQQKILIGIKDKIYESNLSLTDMINLISVLGDNVRTNMSLDEIKTAAHLTFEFDFDKIRQITLMDYENNVFYMTTGMINGISYVFPAAGVGNYDEVQEYVKANLLTEPEPEPELEAEVESEIINEDEVEEYWYE